MEKQRPPQKYIKTFKKHLKQHIWEGPGIGGGFRIWPYVITGEQHFRENIHVWRILVILQIKIIVTTLPMGMNRWPSAARAIACFLNIHKFSLQRRNVFHGMFLYQALKIGTGSYTRPLHQTITLDTSGHFAAHTGQHLPNANETRAIVANKVLWSVEEAGCFPLVGPLPSKDFRKLPINNRNTYTLVEKQYTIPVLQTLCFIGFGGLGSYTISLLGCMFETTFHLMLSSVSRKVA